MMKVLNSLLIVILFNPPNSITKNQTNFKIKSEGEKELEPPQSLQEGVTITATTTWLSAPQHNQATAVRQQQEKEKGRSHQGINAMSFRAGLDNTQDAILNRINKYTKEIKEAESTVAKVDQGLYGIFSNEILKEKGEDVEEDTGTPLYVAIYQNVSEEWSQIEHFLEPYEFDEDSSFINPDDRLIVIASQEKDQRDSFVNMIRTKASVWSYVAIEQLLDIDITHTSRYIAFMPYPAEQGLITRALEGIPIRNSRISKDGKSTTIAFFCKEHFNKAVELESISISGKEIPIHESFLSSSTYTYKLWLGSIYQNAKKNMVEKRLRAFGINFTSFEFCRSKKTRMHLGCGFVQFPDAESLINARKITVSLNSRNLRWDNPKKALKETERSDRLNDVQQF